MTYFVQAIYGDHFQDFYLFAPSITAAQKTAARLFAKSLGIPTKFIRTAA